MSDLTPKSSLVTTKCCLWLPTVTVCFGFDVCRNHDHTDGSRDDVHGNSYVSEFMDAVHCNQHSFTFNNSADCNEHSDKFTNDIG